MPLRAAFDISGLCRIAASQKDYCDDYSVTLTATILGKVTKKKKAVCANLKKIYSAVNLDEAEFAKEEFCEKWAELTIFFEYPQEIRKIIYTTNTVESYHRMVRKFTKSKSIFPTDDYISKVIYMSVS